MSGKLLFWIFIVNGTLLNNIVLASCLFSNKAEQKREKEMVQALVARKEKQMSQAIASSPYRSCIELTGYPVKIAQDKKKMFEAAGENNAAIELDKIERYASELPQADPHGPQPNMIDDPMNAVHKLGSPAVLRNVQRGEQQHKGIQQEYKKAMDQARIAREDRYRAKRIESARRRDIMKGGACYENYFSAPGKYFLQDQKRANEDARYRSLINTLPKIGSKEIWSIIMSYCNAHDISFNLWTAGLRRTRKIHGGLGGSCEFAAFSPDDKRIVTIGGLDGKRVRVSSLANGALIREWQKEGYHHFASFSPDSKYIVTDAEFSDVSMWDVESGALIRKFPHHKNYFGDSVRSAVFSHNGEKIMTTSDCRLCIWNVADGQLEHAENAHGGLMPAAFSSDDRGIITIKNYKFAPLWCAAWKKIAPKQKVWEAFRSADLSSDGTKIITTSRHDKYAQIWESLFTINNITPEQVAFILLLDEYKEKRSLWERFCDVFTTRQKKITLQEVEVEEKLNREELIKVYNFFSPEMQECIKAFYDIPDTELYVVSHASSGSGSSVISLPVSSSSSSSSSLSGAGIQ